jgi:hypothetical protein
VRRIAVVFVLVMAAGCGESTTPSSSPTEGAEEPTDSVSPAPLVGEWSRLTTCEELVQVLDQAGFADEAPEAVVGNGFVPGVTKVDQLADPADPCTEAKPRQHSHFFTEDGRFGSLDWNGEQVDDGTYTLVDDSTFVISKEFPDVTFHFEIVDDAITFEPEIPEGCSEFRCQWAVSMAYPGTQWDRVS